jgi:hypothetical protein
MGYPDSGNNGHQVNGYMPLIRYILLSEVSIVCLLAYLPKAVIWRVVAFIGVAYFTVSAIMSRTGDAMTDYSVGGSIGARAATNFYLVFLADPLDNFRHERDEMAPREMSFLRRIWWAFCVINGPRGVGWNYSVWPLLVFVALRSYRVHAHAGCKNTSTPIRGQKGFHSFSPRTLHRIFLLNGLILDIRVLQSRLLSVGHSQCVVDQGTRSFDVLCQHLF